MEVLRDRGFRLLLGAQGVSMFGDRMVAIALAFAVLELDGSPTEVGLVLAARTLPLVACLLLGGVVADRASRRGVMVASDLVRLASQGLLAGLLIAGAAEIWMLAVLSGITGAAGGFFNPAAVGLLPGIVSPEHLQQANGIRATVYSVSEIAGPDRWRDCSWRRSAPAGRWASTPATFAVSAAFLALLRAAAARRARRARRSSPTCATAGRRSAPGRGCGPSSAGPRSRTWCGERGACSARSSPTATSAGPPRGA